MPLPLAALNLLIPRDLTTKDLETYAEALSNALIEADTELAWRKGDQPEQEAEDRIVLNDKCYAEDIFGETEVFGY